MFSNFVFDLYGTLIDIRTDEEKLSLYEELCDYLSDFSISYQPEELKKRYFSEIRKLEQLPSQYRYPELDILRVFDEISMHTLDKQQLMDMAAFYRRKSTELLQLYPGVKQLLGSLKEKGKRIILLSNAQACFTNPEIDQLGLREYFDSVYISSDYGVRKPDEAFFHMMIKKEKISPGDSVMIGNDYFCDIEPAQKAGMKGIYIFQQISPQQDRSRDINCLYRVMDGDFEKLSQYLKSICE